VALGALAFYENLEDCRLELGATLTWAVRLEDLDLELMIINDDTTNQIRSTKMTVDNGFGEDGWDVEEKLYSRYGVGPVLLKKCCRHLVATFSNRISTRIIYASAFGYTYHSC
jgi:hypothetical protein